VRTTAIEQLASDIPSRFDAGHFTGAAADPIIRRQDTVNSS